MATAALTFDDDYAPDGSIGMTLTVTGGAMREPGKPFHGSGRVVGFIPFTYEGTAPDLFGDFGAPQHDAAPGEDPWTVEPDGEPDYVAGTARFVAHPPS